jgi:hypothetical protein
MLLPLYEMFPGNTADKTTLCGLLALIQKRYGRAERIWVMDRGIPHRGRAGGVVAGRREGELSCRHTQGTADETRKSLSEKPWQAHGCRQVFVVVLSATGQRPGLSVAVVLNYRARQDFIKKAALKQ